MVDCVYPLRGHTSDMATANELLADSQDPYGFLCGKAREVIGDEFPIDM